MQQIKMKLSDDLVEVLKRLSMNEDIQMAGRVLHAYLIRFWKLESEDATRLVRRYFEKHYPEQLERYVKKRRQRN